MLNLKRVTIATSFGLVFGVIYYWLICYPFGHIHPWPGIVTIILVRALMGFTIGISAWKISWWLHGLLIGLLFGVLSGFIGIWIDINWIEFLETIGFQMLFGFLIELTTSIGFKARMP